MSEVGKSIRQREKSKISSSQLRNLVILTYVGTAIAIIPGAVTGMAKQDGWLGAILGTVGGMVFIIIYNLLGNKLKSMTIVEYMEYIFGKIIGKFIGLLFTLCIFIACATQLWIVGDFLITQMMPETPNYIIHILFTIVVIIGSRLGIEVLARSTEIIFPWIIIALSILVISILPEIEFKKIQPVFAVGVTPLIKSALFFMASSSTTLIAMLMIFPNNINNIKKGKKSFLIGALLGGVILVGITILSILVLGPDITDRSTYPTYVLAKKIQIGEFLQRIEVIFAMVWFITVFYKISIYFYGSVLSLSQILDLRDYRVITLPMALILIVLSLVVYPSLTYAQYWDATTGIPFVMTYGLLLPIILIIVGKFRRKK